VSVRDADKAAIVEISRALSALGFSILATVGTADALKAAGIEAHRVKKVLEGRPHIVDNMLSGHVDLVINTTEGAQAIRDSFSLRHTALTHNIPYYTTVEGARAAVRAIEAMRDGHLEVAPLQTYLTGSF
jgi:carbamoyl-phosphate synthase large subunit